MASGAIGVLGSLFSTVPGAGAAFGLLGSATSFIIGVTTIMNENTPIELLVTLKPHIQVRTFAKNGIYY